MKRVSAFALVIFLAFVCSSALVQSQSQNKLALDKELSALEVYSNWKREAVAADPAFSQAHQSLAITTKRLDNNIAVVDLAAVASYTGKLSRPDEITLTVQPLAASADLDGQPSRRKLGTATIVTTG